MFKNLIFFGLINFVSSVAVCQIPYTLPSSTGWETQETVMWNAGAIAGQNGWIAATTLTNGEVIVETTTLGGRTIAPKAGLQMVMSKSSYAGDDFHFATPDPVSLATSCHVTLAQTPVLLLEADFYLPSSEAGKDGWHGLYVFDNENAANGGGGNYGIAGVLLRNKTQTLQLDGDGMTLIPNAFPRDQWFHVRLLVDFQRHLAFAYVNGVLIAEEAASNTSTTQTFDGTGNVGYLTLCSLSPKADSSGMPYTINPSGPPPTDPNAYYAPQTVAFSDNFAASTLSVTQAPAVGPMLTAPLTFEGVGDLNASPGAIPTGYSATTVVADLIGPITFTIRPAGSMTTLMQKSEYFAQANGDTGSCVLFGLAPGSYDIAIKSLMGLQSVVPGVIVSSNGLTLPVTNIRAGDANNDNSVDSSDFGVLIGSFNTDGSIPGSGYDQTADFNYDGFVDSSDFGLFIGDFNTTGDP